jgi:hypothetical protein
MGYSGAGGKPIHDKKNQKQKYQDTVPLTISVTLSLGILRNLMTVNTVFSKRGLLSRHMLSLGNCDIICTKEMRESYNSQGAGRL